MNYTRLGMLEAMHYLHTRAAGRSGGSVRLALRLPYTLGGIRGIERLILIVTAGFDRIPDLNQKHTWSC